VAINLIDLVNLIFNSRDFIIALFIFLLYTYLFFIDRKKYIIVWLTGWGAILLLSILCALKSQDIGLIITAILTDPLLLNLLLLFGVFILLNGTYLFFGYKLPIIWILVTSLTSAYLVIVRFSYPGSYSVLNLPYRIIADLLTLWIGILFLRNSEIEKVSKYITGSSYILLGIIKLCLPYIGQYPIYKTLSSIFYNLLYIFIALGTFLIFFEKVKGDSNITERKFLGAFETSAIGIAIVSKSGKFIEVNKALCNITGYAEEELMSKTFQDITYHEDINIGLEYLSQVMSGEICSFQIEKRYIHKDRHTIWSLLNVSLIKNNSGQPLYLVSQILDISDRKSTEELLKKSEERYKLLLESIPDIVAVLDHNSRYTMVNNAVLRLVNKKSREDLLGHKITDILPGFEETPYYKAYKRVMETQNPVTIIDKYRYPQQEGRSTWYEVHSFPVPEGVMFISSDITGRMRAIEMLRDSQDFIYAVLNTVDALVLAADPYGRIITFNHACEKISGYKLNEVKNKYIWDILITPEEIEKVKSLFFNIKPGETQVKLENFWIAKDGNRRLISWSNTSLLDKNGSIKHVIATGIDITEQKKAERLEAEIKEKTTLLIQTLELDRLRTEFFANLSHEFRTPLNIILGSTQLLFMYLENESAGINANKFSSKLKYIKQNCYRLLRLVNNLIDATKIDAGYLELNPLNCNIVNIVEEIALSVAEYIKSKNLNLTFNTNIEKKIIACDLDAIERILLNLLANAVKFTTSGGSIYMYLFVEENYVSITVQDTGVGIPEDKLGQIFERFRQVDKTLTRSHEGSGIGLSLVKSLVEMHGGTISVESEYLKGAKFTIQLPARLIESNDGTPYGYNNHNNNNIEGSFIERMNIEFSDIYF